MSKRKQKQHKSPYRAKLSQAMARVYNKSLAASARASMSTGYAPRPQPQILAVDLTNEVDRYAPFVTVHIKIGLHTYVANLRIPQ